MISCVRFSDVVTHLRSIGLVEVGGGEGFRAFERASDLARQTIRPPNVARNIPEMIVDDALSSVGLTAPSWEVFRCD